MKDAASIAKEWNISWELNLGPSLPDLAERIERYAARLVNAERERCAGIVKESRGTGEMGQYERAYMCDAIVEKIQATRPSRKRK